MPNYLENPTGVFLTDPTGLKGDEQFVCELYSRQGHALIWEQPDGEQHVIIHTGGIFGHYELASQREAIGVLKRYAARSNLRQGQRVEMLVTRRKDVRARLGQCVDAIIARTCKEVLGEPQTEPVLDLEPCTFVRYLDEKNRALVIRPNGERAETAMFEPYRFRRNEYVWVRIGDRWVWACHLATTRSGQHTIRYRVEGPTPGSLPKEMVCDVEPKDVLAEAESVPARDGEYVRAYVGGRWFDNCTFRGGSVGAFRVRTRSRMLKRATRVHPMKMLALTKESSVEA